MGGSYSLRGGENIITSEKDDAWHVTSGKVLIYVAPWKNGIPGRRAFLCEAKAGEVIPSLCLKDYEYTDWRFCLLAADTAGITAIKGGNTSVLRARFAQRAGIRDFEREGFDRAVVNFYKLTVVAEDGLIHKTIQERKTTSENTLRLIYNVFNKKQLKIKAKNAESPLYNAVAIICGKSGIPVASFERILAACPGGFSINDIARISHFSCREVVLDENWHKSDSGALLAFDEDGRPVACIPKRQRGYMAHDAESGEVRTITQAKARLLNSKAYAIYRPLPYKSLCPKDLFRFCIKSVNIYDIAQIVLFTAITAIVGLLIPHLNLLLYDTLIPSGTSSAVLHIGLAAGTAMIGGMFFAVAKNIANFRVSSRISIDFQCAMQDRLFNLPTSFYRKYESADLAQRMCGAPLVVGAGVNLVLATGLTAVLSLVYFWKMADYSARLSWAAVLMLAAYAAALLAISRREKKYQAQIQELAGKADSTLYQYINGIPKIRMAGAEDRALFECMKLYTQACEIGEKRSIASSIANVLPIASSGLFSAVLYWILVHGGAVVSLGEFIAFTSAFGIFSGAFMQVVFCVSQFSVLKSKYDRCKPVMTEAPEFDEAEELPGELTGELEISNVSFAYSKDTPLVINNVSLTIRAGEYIGIAGPSGCGKSTLLKLLLGFETPTAGKIYYDGKDIENLDKRELRKKMGVVLQDGKLISGSIYENITITSPNSTLSDAQEIVRAVGLEKDISDMPMGIHTILSEECGTISGGQQQRILIARAIIGKPGILFFDEATSALDNVTQAMVCESLDDMDATRIVIAHRLSTIIKCDRIIVMDSGRVVEQGKYQELMDSRGLFYELASRQIM